MADQNSVRSDGLLSDDRVREALRSEIDLAINVSRRMTRQELAAASEVNVYTIDAITSRDPAKHRKVCAATALSLAVVLGPRAVNRILALIGYGGAQPLDEVDGPDLHNLVATGLQHFTTIASAAADGRIDHTEAPLCREAADMIIQTVLPLSSASEAA